jgi:hypothetical protein
MVFVHQTGKKKEVVGDLPLAAITAISPNKVFLGPTIQVSVPSATGVDNIGIVFNSGQGDDHSDSHRIRERDQWLAHIKVLREAAVNAARAPRSLRLRQLGTLCKSSRCISPTARSQRRSMRK